MTLEDYLAERRALVEAALLARVEGRWGSVPARLVQAMRYSLFAGGKRLRPILALAAAEAVGGLSRGFVLEAACAIELVHTYSLIHDDLPCMDDDDLRRGRPTSHKVFGEALAVLAGDALLTEAFRFLSCVGGSCAPRLTAELAVGAGAAGMVGGQVMDVEATGSRALGPLRVEEIHRRKTAMLMAASCAAGAIAADGNPALIDRLREFGTELGLAFQAADDWLDIEGQIEARGKQGGRDRVQEKATLVSELGIEGAKRRAAEHAAVAESLVSELPAPERLKELARYSVTRRS